MKTLAFTMLLLMSALVSLAQCPDCTPDLSCTTPDPFPTICPLILPDATTGEDYETTLTFYLPAQIVDPDTEIEATLEEVEVVGVNGLPFGMTFTLNSDNNTYFPSQGDEYGCATICGTPLLAGNYDVVINVNVVVVAFGFTQELAQSFSLPLTVLQGEGGNASFSIDQVAACGSLEVNPEALITEGGVVSYDWNFGNGSTSSVPFPPTVTYSSPGDYTISLNTTVQNYVLTGASILVLGSGWGGDVDDGFGLLNPDPYFVISDFQGNTVYTAPYLDNVETGSWSDLNITLQEGTYTIAYYDSDGTITSDDFLGETTFQVSAGNLVINAGGTSGTINIELQTSAAFSDEEVVSVFPNPSPIITGGGIGEYLVATGENLSTYTWFLSGDTLQNQVNDSLLVELPGVYGLSVNNAFGCSAAADSLVVCPQVLLSYNELTQTISSNGSYDTYAWFYNGLLLGDENDAELLNAAPGNYALEITTSYGCVVTSPVLTVEAGDGIGEQEALSITLYPQPAINELNLSLPIAGNWVVSIYDQQGRLIEQLNLASLQSKINVSHLTSGIYILSAQHENGHISSERFIKK